MSTAFALDIPLPREDNSVAEPAREMEARDNQTFGVGAILLRQAGTAFRVEEAGADPALIFGVAMTPATRDGTLAGPTDYALPLFETTTGDGGLGQVSKRVVVARARAAIFEFSLGHTGQPGSRGTLAATDAGATYGITRFSLTEGGLTRIVWTIDKSKTAGTARVRILDWDKHVYRVGDTGVRVRAVFLDANVQD